MAVSYIRLGSTFAGQLSRRKQKVCVKRTSENQNPDFSRNIFLNLTRNSFVRAGVLRSLKTILHA
jgi:hypothetical protein